MNSTAHHHLKCSHTQWGVYSLRKRIPPPSDFQKPSRLPPLLLDFIVSITSAATNLLPVYPVSQRTYPLELQNADSTSPSYLCSFFISLQTDFSSSHASLTHEGTAPEYMNNGQSILCQLFEFFLILSYNHKNVTYVCINK